MISCDLDNARIRNQGGFFLVEILVAVFIVGLSLTVFFQLLSGSMKLSYKGRHLLNSAIHADEIFSGILLQDITSEDFVWHAEIEQGKWDLQLEAIEIQEPDVDNDELNIILPADLYRLVFTLYAADGRPVISLASVRQYPLNYFSEDFKQEHVYQFDDQGGQ